MFEKVVLILLMLRCGIGQEFFELQNAMYAPEYPYDSYMYTNNLQKYIYYRPSPQLPYQIINEEEKEEEVPEEDPAESHRGREVAPYVIKDIYEDYEERQYPEMIWVCTMKPTTSTIGYNKLRNYITGKNSQGLEMEMTTPVMKEYLFDKLNEMCFYISKSNQNNVPKPTDPDVYIAKMLPTTILARRFSGYATEEDWEVQHNILMHAIKINKESVVDFTRYYRSVYDSPMRLFNRRNEVWFVKHHKN